MISSQIASVSRASISPFVLQSSIASSTAMLRSSGSLPRKSWPHHQIRTLRLGLWSSYLDPSFEKEVQRRHRIIKHKYLETLDRKLSWDRWSPISSKHLGLKEFMCSAWRGHDPRPGGRWVDIDELNASKDAHQTSTRGIEDVEQIALDNLLNSKYGLYNIVRARSRIFGRRLHSSTSLSSNGTNNPTPSSSGTSQTDNSLRRVTYGQEGFRRRFQSQQSLTPDPEYEIDPITNRKVFKSKTSENNQEPTDVPVETFKGYRSQFQDFLPPASKPSESDLTSYSSPHRPFFNEPIELGEPCDPVRESLKDYAGDQQYKPFFGYEPDGQIPKQPCPVQDGLKDFDNRASYGPVMYREPDGRLPEQPDPVQEGLKDYDTKVAYGSIIKNEPDGKLVPNKDGPAESVPGFDSVSDYVPRRILKNIYLGLGNDKTDKSFRYANDTDKREDLDLLRTCDVRAASGIIKGIKKETEAEMLTRRRELEDDFQRLQDLETSRAEEVADVRKGKEKRRLVENLRVENGELQNVNAHIKGRINAKLEEIPEKFSSKPAERMTGNFIQDFPGEFEVRWAAELNSESLSPKTGIDSTGHGKTSEDVKLPVSHPEVLENAFRNTQGKQVDGLGPREAFSRNPSTPRIETSLDRSFAEASAGNDNKNVGRSQVEIDPHSKLLESSYAEESALDIERDPYSKVPQGLETSYAEECWLQNEIDPYSKKPQGLETSYAEEVAAQSGEGEASEFSSSYGTLNRDNREEKDGQHHNSSRSKKKALKKVLKQKDQDLVREVRSIYEDTYGNIDYKHRQVPEVPKASEVISHAQGAQAIKSAIDSQEATVYKILAYDPTMQSISTAETTSIVPDSAAALTPAEVLLRLSNPAKFFPHFGPLQAQGYEIVSGSGDVLVFRKVRVAGPEGRKSESTSTIQNLKRTATNPIDGMQSNPIVATGNFASPTGFVNHDLPVSDPPFKSNIDVRREEPVFSGKSNWQEKSSQGTTKGRGKRLLIGAAWVAGCSYAIGVVAEYFRTGGIDGIGPQGF